MTKLEWVLAAMVKAWALTSAVPGGTPRDVAQAIATASEEKPLFTGADAWRRTAAAMVGIARWESGFRQVAGDCKGLPPGDPACGRAGTTPTSFCFMQVHLPNGQRTAEGWTAEELMADPLKCARAGREILRRSVLDGAARGVHPLTGYAVRHREATRRWDLALRLFDAVAWTE